MTEATNFRFKLLNPVIFFYFKYVKNSFLKEAKHKKTATLLQMQPSKYNN